MRLANCRAPGMRLVLRFILYLFLSQKWPGKPFFGKNPVLYYPCSRFLYVYVSSVSSCTRAAVAATQQPTAIQQQHHNDNSSSSTSVSTRGRQRKQARMKEQVKCCREPAMYEYFMFLSSFFVVPSSFIVRKANRQKQLILIFPSTGDTQPCDGPPSKLYHF